MTEEKQRPKELDGKESNASDSNGGEETSISSSSDSHADDDSSNEANDNISNERQVVETSAHDYDKGDNHDKDDFGKIGRKNESPAGGHNEVDKARNSTSIEDDNVNSSKSRKRTTKTKKKGDRESMELEWKQERYDKLLYMANKDLTKHVKQAKTFVCQKLIRKLKQQQTQQASPQDGEDSPPDPKSSSQKKPSKVEKELKLYKSLGNDIVVQEAVRRLGLIALNPSWTPNLESIKQTEANDKVLVDAILNHKKMETCLEQWNEKVTEFRRWCLRRTEMAAGKRGRQADVFTDDLNRSNKNKRRKNTKDQASASDKRRKNDGNAHLSASNLTDSSIFCSLGGEEGSDNDEGDDGDNDDMDPTTSYRSAYGPGGDEYDQRYGAKKKNRKGQRARRAKALAMQAKKDGRTYESANWRKKKTADADNDNEGHGQHYRKSQNQHQKRDVGYTQERRRRHVDDHQSQLPKSLDETQKRQETRDAAQHHPSWAAKQAQSTGIVAFQGKKITFD